MNCKACGHALNQYGICPVCGWQDPSYGQQPSYNGQQIPYQQPYSGQQMYNQQPYNGQQMYSGQQMYNQQPYNGQQMYNQQSPYNGQQVYNQQMPYQQPQGSVPPTPAPKKKEKMAALCRHWRMCCCSGNRNCTDRNQTSNQGSDKR